MRYAQCAALFPMMQFSDGAVARARREHLEIAGGPRSLHARLDRQIVGLAAHAAATGEPIMRHLAFVYPDDGFEDVQDQFMLGDNILVAPVIAQGAKGAYGGVIPTRARGTATMEV